MKTILKPSALKADPGRILDEAMHHPLYVDRNGVLMVITKAGPLPPGEDALLSPWELRAQALERLYDPAKAW